MNRNETSVEVEYKENKISLNGKISVFNCSNKIQEFRIKIKSPYFVKNHTNKDYIDLRDGVKIYPKEEVDLYINEEFDYAMKREGTEYGGQAFEYVLFNEDEIVFKGRLDDYNIDKMDSNY